MPFHPIRRAVPLLLAAVALAGCTGASSPRTIPSAAPATLTGALRGGQQPVANATIQLYAVGTTGDGSASTPLLTRPVSSAADGSFQLTGLFTCPAAETLVYLLATGGDAGVGGNNSALAMMAAIGPCGNLTAATFLMVDEVTSVAAVAPIASAGFFASPTAIGSSPANAPLLAAAFTSAAQLADTTTGTAPGTSVPSATTVPVQTLDTLANLISACINSAGGVAGDGSICGKLFALEAVPSLVTPADTLALLARIALEPAANVALLYALLPAQPVFVPSLASTPASLAIALEPAMVVATSALAFPSTYVGAVAASQAITFANTSTQPVVLSPATLAGVDSTDFAQLTNCPPTLAAQSTCTVWITFAPASAGTRTAAFDLAQATAQNVFIPILANAAANPPTTFASSLDSATVFMGASIVQLWPLPIHNAGIYGQTTPQMVARFAADVLGHGYTRVVILGGSNDITQGLSLQGVTIPDLLAMGQMASAAGLEVVLSQLPPITLNGVNFNPQVQTADDAIRQLAIEQGWLVVDYYTPMAGHPEYFIDGEHPNATGYAVMEAALAANVTR